MVIDIPPMYSYQMDAVNKMRTGSILCGGVGSGKSRTSLCYYYTKGGRNDSGALRKLIIITTARKRDTKEWDAECDVFKLSKDQYIVDSWNNIGKYAQITDSFFIFDEQRVVGKGAWVKTFLTIAKHNEWILLSATPGDTWTDYVPVFIANGYYKNRTQFEREHVIWARFSSYPKINGYVATKKLEKLRDEILVDMDYERKTVQNHQYVAVPYNVENYKLIQKNRWDYEKDEPIVNASGLCYALRKVVNSDMERINMALDIAHRAKRSIIFYNFDYELELLEEHLWWPGAFQAEWNGHRHEAIPEGEEWVYLVQYNAGAEGWNCITADTIIFYSQNYSYKMMAQAAGRIDRLNTPFDTLHYYHLRSQAPIDRAIAKAIKEKKNFNERHFAGID